MTDLHGCRLCPRLASYRLEQQARFPGYHNLPVASFGPDSARLLIVGLAPGLHGANATGRPFTGDASGDLLFSTLYKFGFADREKSRESDDGMRLRDCRITNAVKCVPPGNRPVGSEIDTCNDYLRAEIDALRPGSMILALGAIAHRSILKVFALPQAGMRFAHLAEHALPGELILIDSYHCSRYNINTRRLSTAMFEAVFERVRQLVQ